MSIITKVEELRLEEPGLTWEAMAKQLGFSTGEALRSEYRRRKADEQIDEIETDKPKIEFLHSGGGEAPDWRELAERSAVISEKRSKISPLIKSTRAYIATKSPIGIVFSGDWHLGSSGLDYKKWLKDMETIMSNDKLFLVDLGDDRQNMRSFKDLSGVLEQVMTPKEQALFMRGLVNELTDTNKLLCKVDGNHDVEFDERIFGEALQWYLMENMKAPRFKNKGLLFLEVGDETYSMYVFHKSRFRSIFRAAHGAFREWQFGYPADVVAGGHDHTPGFEMLPNYQVAREAGMGFGGLTFLIKIGTYQESKYGYKYFHNGGAPEAITIVLWPDTHKMQAFLSIEDAARFIDTYETEEKVHVK